jgi:RNA polymerase sigma factor (TIGR02999 family)
MPESCPNSVTHLLDAAGRGDASAREELWATVYEELHRLARGHIAGEAPGRTLQPTALVHEAFLKLIGGEAIAWSSRHHFFGAAARAMRQILVDDARRRRRLKRGGQYERVPLSANIPFDGADPTRILIVDEALSRLERADRGLAEVVLLRVFAGLSGDDTARILGVSSRTIDSRWRFARAWLRRELETTTEITGPEA